MNLQVAITQCEEELGDFKATYHDMITALQDVVTDSALVGAGVMNADTSRSSWQSSLSQKYGDNGSERWERR